MFDREIMGDKLTTSEHSCSTMTPVFGEGTDACQGKKDKCFTHKKVSMNGLTLKDIRVCCCSGEKWVELQPKFGEDFTIKNKAPAYYCLLLVESFHILRHYDI